MYNPEVALVYQAPREDHKLHVIEPQYGQASQMSMNDDENGPIWTSNMNPQIEGALSVQYT